MTTWKGEGAGRTGGGSARNARRGAASRGDVLVPPSSRRGLIGTGALLGAAGLVLGPGLARSALANQATGFRLGRHTQKTRIVVDLAEQPAYRVFTLTDPRRLVIDLLESDWLVPAGALPGAVGPVSAVRHGLLNSGATRIVLDLTEPVAVRDAFALSPREGYAWRLVIDVAETSARAFHAEAGSDRAIVSDANDPPAPREIATTDQLPMLDPPPPRPSPSSLPASTAVVQTVTGGGLTPAAFVPVPVRKPPLPRKPLIAVDPGHGGRDPGAISVNGIYEKDITLAMGKELRKVLTGTGRYRVVMTRDRDVSVHLRERVRRARQAGADLFLSIHADALGNSNVRGLSVYTLSEKASDAEAAALADRENKADIILGMDFSTESTDVTNILIDLAQRETMNRSVVFANTLLRQLPPEVRTLNHSRRYAGFAVLKAPDVPSVLLEMGYLSNRTDEKLLRQRAYRAKLAQAVVGSLDRFFAEVQGARLP